MDGFLGKQVAEVIVKEYMEKNGTVPETVAVNLWGLDSIKTKGESVAIVLTLVGAQPVQEGTGRIARYELLPLEELKGRPRIDVLCHMSGIFRDAFQNVVELLDDMFKRAAEADEPIEMNFIRKHALEMQNEGMEGSTARLFSNPAGDFGSMVNERVGTSDWTNGQELGSTWASRYSFAYGRGEKGAARPEVLQSLLKSTQQIVQEIDSVEYGLTDIQARRIVAKGFLKRAFRSIMRIQERWCAPSEMHVAMRRSIAALSKRSPKKSVLVRWIKCFEWNIERSCSIRVGQRQWQHKVLEVLLKFRKE